AGVSSPTGKYAQTPEVGRGSKVRGRHSRNGAAIRAAVVVLSGDFEMRARDKVSRRQILSRAAAASIAMPTIVPSSVFGNQDKPPPSERITVGFIGCGKMANDYHLPELLGFGDVQALAVCEVDRSRLEHARKRVDKAYGKKADDKGCAAYVDF